MAFEIARCRSLYREADAGIALLPPASARGIGTARVLYAGILDRIERAGGDVFTARARVPTWRKLATAAGAVVTRRPAGRSAPARSPAVPPTPTRPGRA
jgi:phytoene synthase